MREIKFRIWNPKINPPYMRGPFTLKQAVESDNHNLGPENLVMQYTSLKDRHGKDIYEGDIVKMFNGQLAEVAFERVIAAFHMSGQPMTETFCRNSEILGNIYENPELMK